MENKILEVMDLDGWQLMFIECDEWPEDFMNEPERMEADGD